MTLIAQNTSTIRSRYTNLLATLLLLTGLALAVSIQLRVNSPVPSPSAPGGALDIGKLPLLFEPAVGQLDPSAQFTARAAGGTLSFMQSEVELALRPLTTAKEGQEGAEAQASLLRMSFIGADPHAALKEGNTAAGQVNYFIGSDPAQWRAGNPTYTSITYSGLYPGIDLHYSADNTYLKGTFIVAPYTDPSLISWRYTGAGSLRVDEAGNLRIQVQSAIASGTNPPLEVVETAPVAWQEIEGERILVTASYRLAQDGSISFALGAYDRTRPLTIDPTLTYSTYLGGNFAEYGFGIAADAAGNFYVVGITNSSNFPMVNAFQSTNQGIYDVIVAKFNPAGQPIYITYLGGSNIDWGLDIKTDPDGNAYITGFTSSTNFPVANAYQPAHGGGNYDAFITKLNPTGSALLFSTYLGGSGTENSHGSGPQSGAIALDANRNIYVTGFTASTNFPVLNALQPALVNIEDGFITKFNPAGSALVWSTYLGGIRNDQPKGIALDQQNNVIIAGWTTSADYPLANAYQIALLGTLDAFVSKINAAGSALVYSTYLGGTDYEYPDQALDVAVDPQGNAYITGFTGSTDFPTTPGSFQFVYNGGGVDAFVSKFTPVGGLAYSTYLGGTWSDTASSIAVNSNGEAFVMGSTQSSDYPTLNPLYPQLRGSEDALITHFNAAGSALLFSTYFGGSDNREMQAQGALTIDAANNIYITGNTESSDFPTTANAFQPFRASTEDAFISRISENNPTPTSTAATTGTATPTVCPVSDYSITESTGATIVPGTTFLPNSDCNDCTAPMVLPFPVQFYNQTFTQARASSNGNLQFTSNSSLPFESCLPNPTYDNVIYGYWDDLFLDCRAGWGCGIYTSISGTAPNRIFNIEWRAHRNEPPIVNIKFEIRLYENSNGRFDIIYGQLDNPGNSATVGAQRDTGSRFTQYSCDTGVLSQGLQLTFTLPSCNATPTPGGSTPIATSTPSITPTPPTLLYSTYHGSFERDSIEDIAKDAAGNIYVAGTTFQNDIDYGDIYVSKFTPDGHTLLYQTILGGTRIDYGYGLAVDAAGNATVTGIATSNDYPLLNPLQATHHLGIYDAVLTKLNPTGGILFSTYLGGSGTDYGSRVTTDTAGNVYLIGHTSSTDFPTTAGVFQPSNAGSTDGYITKITPNGSAIVWSTYLGGIYTDEVHDIALDSASNIYLTGFAGSPNFPMLNAFQSTYYDGEAFVTKMNPQGTALIYSTYLGGNNPPGPGEDNGQGITVDAEGSAYVTGFTQSPNFPTTPGSYQPFFRGYFDAFVTKLTPEGNTLAYSTFVGGTLNPPYGDDEAFDIAVDDDGQAHITGKTNSPDFPVVRAAQGQKADVYDGFVTKLNNTGTALIYSTYLGGHYHLPNYNGEDSGQAILIDSASNAVIGGGTASDDFPIANPYQASNAGKSDGFIVKISGSRPQPTVTVTPSATASRTPTSVSTGTALTSTPASTASTPTVQVTGTPSSTATAPGITPGASVTATLCAITFTDVPFGSTFYSNIQCLACRSIVSGYPCGGDAEPCDPDNNPYFRPSSPVTRGQLAKIVSNSAGFTDPPAGQTFEDVVPGTAFYDFVERLASRGVMGGYPCGIDPIEPCGLGDRPYFRPGAGATRGQLTKIVANAASFNDPPPTTSTFTDVPAGSPFHIYVERLLMRRPGVMGGYPCGGLGEPCDPQNHPYFRPGNSLSRGQTSKIVGNTFYPNCQTTAR